MSRDAATPKAANATARWVERARVEIELAESWYPFVTSRTSAIPGDLDNRGDVRERHL